MKRIRKQNRLIAALICVLALLLTGCGGKTEEEATVNEEVQLSNIRFPDMKLTSEEKAMMRKVQEMLDTAELYRTADSYGRDTLKLENTTPYTLTADIVVNCFDEDDVLVTWYSLSLAEWKPGEEVETKISGHNSVSDIVNRAEILAEYVDGSAYYRTAFVPIKLTQEKSEIPVQIEVKGGLPQVITKKSWSGTSVYTVTSFTFTEGGSDDKYDFVMYLTKQSGKPESWGSIEYRLIRDDGVVAANGTIYLSYIKSGETVRVAEDYVDLSPGTYSLEFISGS